MFNAEIENKVAELRQVVAKAGIDGRPVHLERLGNNQYTVSFTGYLRERADTYKELRKRKTWQKTEYCLTELKRFHGAGAIYFDDINLEWVRRLDAWLVSNRKNNANTRIKKLNTYRDFYTNAMDEGKAMGPNPFKQYKLKADPVNKEKLTVKQVNAIEDLKLNPGPEMLARDLWLFSFYTKGVRFETCITITSDSVRDGRVYWQANKGKKFQSTPIHARLQSVIDRYYDKDRYYLFPVLPEQIDDEWTLKLKVESANTTENRHLKTVAALAGLPINLTFHIARHTFAFQLKNKSNNMHVIKDALGHSDSRTTEKYLRALDDEALDPEVEKVYQY